MPFIAAFTAAEAAAAAAATEAAAIAAAEVAAAEAAAATAAQAATTEAATAAIPEALSATSFPQAGGIMEALPGQLQNIQNLASGPGIQVAGLDPSLTANVLPAAGAEASTIAGAAPANIAGAAPVAPVAPAGATPATTAGAAPAGITQAPMSFDTFGTPVPAGSPAATMADPTGLAQLQLEANAAAVPQPSGFEKTFDKFVKYAEKNPFTTGAGLYMTAVRSGLLDQGGASMPQRKSYGPQYRLSENFQAATPEPNVYTPSYSQYAEGGIASIDGPEDQMPTTRMEDGDAPGYAKGGTLSDSLDFYRQMAEARPGKGATAPKADADVGIYYDQDPDTRYQDALTAAQIRQAKLNKRSNVQSPSGGAMRRPTPMGQINLAPPGAKEAAQGGIMQARDSSLGGYAAGGNPRLLKGPGDGMSDNIPAMIGRKQPARLADGEFVIPADVVSHLGNGSTEAGAKRLHEMMNNVRRARTGNPKQGKQINPRKYMPK